MPALKAAELHEALAAGASAASIIENLAEDISAHSRKLREEAEMFGPRTRRRRELLDMHREEGAYARGLREALTVVKIADHYRPTI